MTIELIYSGVPSTNSITNTQKFTNGKAIYLVAPDITDEVEIDFYLQLEIGIDDNRLITLNEEFRADSIRVFTIPEQYQDSDLELYGAFTNTLNIALEIYVILADITLKSLSQQVNEIKDTLAQIQQSQATELTSEVAQAINAIEQNISLAIFSTSLAPLTFGTSLSAFNPLEQGTTALLPFISGQLLPLP